jgi:5'-nucleotidase
MARNHGYDPTLLILCIVLCTCTVAAILFFMAGSIAMPSGPGTPAALTTPLGCLAGSKTDTSDGNMVRIKILAINDFHGQVPDGQTSSRRPVGSAPVLASYLKAATSVFGSSHTIIALPGDVVGASPPESGLLADEPTLLFFNEFANSCCTGQKGPRDSACNIVATVGNHEFDRGRGRSCGRYMAGTGIR